MSCDTDTGVQRWHCHLCNPGNAPRLACHVIQFPSSRPNSVAKITKQSYYRLRKAPAGYAQDKPCDGPAFAKPEIPILSDALFGRITTRSEPGGINRVTINR